MSNECCFGNIGMRDCPYGICCPWVRGGWDLDALGKFFRRRRRRPRLKNRVSKCLTFLHTVAHCSILRLCHEWGQNKRWGAVRHVKWSGIPIRVFLFLCSQPRSKKSVFQRLDVSWFLDVFLKNMFLPKVPQKCSWGVWDHPRPIPAYSGPFRAHSGPKSPKHWHNKIILKKTINIPITNPIHKLKIF